MEVIFEKSAHCSLTAGVELNVDEKKTFICSLILIMKFMINWSLPE